MSQRRRPVDTCADYNAFGRDPYGRIAYLCALFFGPHDYVPSVTSSQFVGRAAPPRYGPPAPYQVPCLPPGFIPQPPPDYLEDLPELDSMDSAWFLDPPEIFDPQAFYALAYLVRFLQHGGECLL